MKVTVLGAGYMGSAMATVAKMRGQNVHLWGTWRDDALLDTQAPQARKHPRLGLALTGITLPPEQGAGERARRTRSSWCTA